ncbi:hypothetical protein AQUCO_01400497v1 [Aquilegia coerulea]|uniref:Uncharacterized protein n=1 Tax=Aquilegia coerulea TaxID=218851 RepID=A0A2G5DWP5_AQUCA|nr:hypothetical protein AQUCO_01400497v1 [Aquilegia coerulea]
MEASQTLLGFNPSYYLELVAKGILQCLGLKSSSTFTPQGEEKRKEVVVSQDHDDSPSFTAEPKMKSRTVNPQVLKSVGRVRATAPEKPRESTGIPPKHNGNSV